VRLNSLWALIALVACEGAPGGDAWIPSGPYRAVLHVERRGPVLPEVRAALGHGQDSIVVPLTIDSVRGDSAFGSWDADFSVLGTYGANALTQPPYPLVAERRGNAVVLRLWPAHTDQDVWLSGKWRDGGLYGTWKTAYSPRIDGSFRFER
jgi:hypothetical protein